MIRSWNLILELWFTSLMDYQQCNNPLLKTDCEPRGRSKGGSFEPPPNPQPSPPFLLSYENEIIWSQ